jgi:CheY-like chemotaxis protein
MNFSGKILVVDDEAHIRKFVTLLVKSLGPVTVLEAANGEDALQIHAREKPDLVLLDVNMPRMDGVQTLEALRKQDPDCVVIMLTSLVNRQTIEECLRLGAAGYLRKDLPPSELKADLTRIIAASFEEDPPSPANP